MTKPNFIFKMLLFVFALSATNIYAQTENKPPPPEPTYEIVLQILAASNGAAKNNAVPNALAGSVKKLKTLYAFTDYRLTTTFLQRGSNSFDYKSQTNDFSGGKDGNETVVFIEWTLRNLRPFRTDSGSQTIQFESFRFNARVPVTIQTGNSEGKSSSVVTYESMGITNSRLSLKENEPTVVGSLGTAKPDEMMFLILTVKAVE